MKSSQVVLPLFSFSIPVSDKIDSILFTNLGKVSTYPNIPDLFLAEYLVAFMASICDS